MKLYGGKMLDKDFNVVERNLYIKGGKISFSTNDEEKMDISGLTVIPGLIDIHIHGFMGVDVMQSDYQGLNKMCQELCKCGTTSFLATTATNKKENIKKALANITDCINKGTDGSEVIGINMEGPFLSKKYKGAMLEEEIVISSKNEFDEYYKIAGSNIKIMSVAPEIKENYDFIDVLKENNIIAAIGHSEATAEETGMAIKKGISHATHLFNAMRGINHREPGAAGAIIDSNITAELICDAFHINEKVIRMTYKLLGKDRLILISDDIPHAGLEDGIYEFVGLKNIVKDGTCRLLDGTINGNVISLYECVKRAIKLGIPFCDAIYCASMGPAKRLGIDEIKGSIDEGKDADLIIINDNMDIKYVIKSGKVI